MAPCFCDTDGLRAKDKKFKLFWFNQALSVYCHDFVPIDLKESVPDPINLFVPYQPLYCLRSISRWEVNVRLHGDTDHTDVPIHSQTHTYIYTHPDISINAGTVTKLQLPVSHTRC